MDSNPPRARVDQYFSSNKKRKFLSPVSKYGVEKRETQIRVEGSPRLQSPDGDFSSGASNSSCEERARLIVGRRILPLQSEPLSREEEKGVSRRCVAGLNLEPSTSGVAKDAHENDSPEIGSVARNPELREFVTGFLSSYCSEMQPILNVPSQSTKVDLPLEESPSKKKRRRSYWNESCALNTSISSPRAIQANNDLDSTCLGKDVMQKNLLVSLSGLRKCNHAHAPEVAECQKTGSSDIGSGSRGTPRSSKGSLSISPGEAFWNEVMNVADGLVVANDLCSHVGKDNQALSVGSRYFISEKVNVGSHDNISNMEVDGVIGMDRDGDSNSARVSLGMQGKNLEKETSPLPVKHIDFGLAVGDFDNGHGANNTKTADLQNQDIACPSSPLHFFQNNAGLTASKRVSNKLVERSLHPNIDSSTSDTSAHEYRTGASIQGCRSHGTPANSVAKGCLRLDDWLPPEICNVYRKKGITELYHWQVECLQVDGVLNNRNLIYCASTSAGKSFVAEILMLRRILATGKVALLVLPYVSICSEKAEHLEALLEPVKKHVRSFYGNQGGGNLPKDASVAVCTIEKANSLINRLLEESRLSELGTVVIDELHMVGDQSRGYLLELMLTKLLYASGEGNAGSGGSSRTSSEKSDTACSLQIVGMSATLPNVAAVAEWLHAALYVTNFRPVPLEEYIKIGNTIYNKEMETVRTIPKVANLGSKDPDQIVELCNEVVQEGHSVLIFCSSRKGCETTARHVAKYLKPFSIRPCVEEGDSFDISFALESLRRSPAGLDPVLEETLPFGVAYHHAGLTVEERETVETCYRKGLVRVLTATSTLAAGVNLPARRVIFRQPRIGRDFIDGTRYKQMAGRAGRTGIDTKGESVLICKPEETKKVLALLNDNCTPLCSCLSEDRNGMTHAILEVVAGGIVQTPNDINRYVRCTLLNSTKPFEDVVKSAQDSLRWLCRKKFLEWNEETKLYSTTPLGRASFGSSLCPEESLVVLDDLLRAREGFVLASDLHLVYLVTPINVDVEPDWELYYERFMQLSLLDQSVGNRVGVQESFLMRMAHGAPSKVLTRSRNNPKASGGKSDKILTSTHDTFSNEQLIRVCKRFYVALILSRLVQEVAVNEVCQGFKVARGMVQALQENAGRFTSMVSVFCERLNWHDLESLVSKFQNRVSFGVRAEIAELTAIPYVKGSRARALYMAGLRTPQAVAEASIPEIMKAIFESSSWESHVRPMQVGVAKKIKNGARKIVLEKAEEARVAAFSAFKSLGFDIPQFSRPIFSFKTENVIQKGFTSSSEEDRKSGYVVSSRLKHAFNAVPSGEGHTIGGSASDLDGGKHSKTAGADIGSLVENPASAVNTKTDNKREIALTNLQGGPISVASIPGGLDSFFDLWNATSAFFFDVHYTKKSEFHSIAPFEIHGIAVCWENSPVYYLNIPRDLLRCSGSKSSSTERKDANVDVPKLSMEMVIERWARITSIMARQDVRKFSWNLKAQIQVLRCPSIGTSKLASLHGGIKSLGVELMDKSSFMFPPIHVRLAIDMAVVAWILSPDEEKHSYPNLEKEVRKRLSSDTAASAKRSGRWKDQMRPAAHNGCCRRVSQTRALFSVLWKLLESENLMEPLLAIEVQLTIVLADMEMRGIGVDMDGCLRARNILGRKLHFLEKEAYRLAGKKFSLTMPAEVSSVLYEHLKLPIPEVDRGKQHPSTDKHCLDLLRDEHPLVAIIKEHRTLSKLLHSTLGSICSLSRLCFKSQRYTVHGSWLQTSTATGRLSMKEPNLQCVEHTIEFNMNDDDGEYRLHNINARSLFVPSQEDWLLLAADYSQIEMRLVAHFSKDSTLIKLLSSPENDVFTMITAKWKNKHESTVTPQERDETKSLVYGMLYGMGPGKLAEALECSLDEAAGKIQNFKDSFPGVASWIQDAVAACKLKGYVETLKRRKRYLTKIKLGNGKEKSRARRQAVNSICQGSAADVIKMAMIYLHGVIDEFGEASCCSFLQKGSFEMLKGRCRILLQVHDELLLEADPLVVKEAGSLLRRCMENAVSLAVPLPVKLKIGKTWGTMEPFDPNS